MSGHRPEVRGAQVPIRPAVRWFLRLRGEKSPELAPEELLEWERFVTQPAHQQELIEVKELWKGVQTLGGPKMPTDAELAADEFDGSIPISQWNGNREKKAQGSWYSRPQRLLLLAASLAAVVFGIAFYAQPGFNWRMQEQVQAFATPRAEQRAVTLADGSIVTLGARTEIHARISAAERVIVLDRGEAWFKVAPERQRPFKVFAGGGVITAVGTEFNVRRDLEDEVDRVTVTVGSGAVKVEPRAAIEQSIAWKTARLVKGQELTYDGVGERGEVRHADIEAAAAWKEGRLEYIHQPLKAVVASVNRYNEKPIVLGDDAVGELDYSGTVFEGQVDEWINALRTAFPISVTETNDRILIQSRISY